MRVRPLQRVVSLPIAQTSIRHRGAWRLPNAESEPIGPKRSVQHIFRGDAYQDGPTIRRFLECGSQFVSVQTEDRISPRLYPESRKVGGILVARLKVWYVADSDPAARDGRSLPFQYKVGDHDTPG